MRLGIRLQIALSLSVLLVLAFVPLFVAVSSLTRATLRNMSDASLLAAARSIGRHAVQARERLSVDDLRSVLQAETSPPSETLAIGLYDEAGGCLLRVGRRADDELPSYIGARPEHESLTNLATASGPAASVVLPLPGAMGAAVVVLSRGDGAARPIPLLRLVGLYAGLFAVGLLVFSYIALTRLIVQPLDAISAAARRVAAGGHKFEAAVRGPAELEGLAASLGEMAARLKADEQSMRRQIEELERGARALREAQDRLVRSERLASVGRLAAGLAHEIGNPLAALIGLEDLLIAGGLSSGEERDFLIRIRSETDRIHRVIRNLLDFTRPACAAVAAQEPPGSVCEAIQDVVALVKPQRAFRDIEIHVRAPVDVPSVALAKERIMQVLLNLLLNAADAACKGSIWLDVEQRDTQVRITVTDSGPGVEGDIVPRLFEPFVTTKEVGKGTGLGLAMCRGLVESVQGTIHFDQEFRDGARFVVTLPIAEAVAKMVQAR